MKVAVIGGGPSREAEVSRVTADQVKTGLSNRHDAYYLEYGDSLTQEIMSLKPDVVFPAMHGVPGEDGSLQGYLEVLGLPYVGSDFAASALAMDKYSAKCVWADGHIPVLPMQLIHSDTFFPDNVSDIEKKLGPSVAIKPTAQGSALGVQLLPEGGDMLDAIQTAFTFGDSLLVEPYIKGREITVAVLDGKNQESRALPIIEICMTSLDEWYDYENRYTEGKSQHVINPPMPEYVAEHLKKYAVQAHYMLGCRDLSRSDFLLTDDNEIWLLELNTMPGMTPTSLYPDAARAAGIEFDDLLDGLVDLAHNRAQ